MTTDAETQKRHQGSYQTHNKKAHQLVGQCKTLRYSSTPMYLLVCATWTQQQYKISYMCIIRRWQLINVDPTFGGQQAKMSNGLDNRKLVNLSTRSPPVGGPRHNAAPLHFTISANVHSNSVCHYWWSCLKPWPNYDFYDSNTRFTHFCAVLNYILQLTESSQWRHICKICEAGCPWQNDAGHHIRAKRHKAFCLKIVNLFESG